MAVQTKVLTDAQRYSEFEHFVMGGVVVILFLFLGGLGLWLALLPIKNKDTRKKAQAWIIGVYIALILIFLFWAYSSGTLVVGPGNNADGVGTR